MLYYNDHRALSARKKLWPDEYMDVQPFTGGEWVHAATMAGRQAGQAANGQSRKALKKTTERE